MPTPTSNPTPAAKPTEPELDTRSPEEIEQARKIALLAKVKTLRENVNLRRGSVTNPDPKKDYIWVNMNDNRQIEFRGMGYEVCRDPKVETRWKKPDGTHQRGDLILYQIDKDLREAIKVSDELSALEGIEAPKAAFHQQVGRAGAVPYEPTPR